jgi:Fur family ferric uptake transcriptional regulator
MCHQCNYEELLASANLEASANRLRVLEIIGNNGFPLSAGDIFKTLERSASINRVTVYRILDLLVDSAVVERISTGGRAFYWCPSLGTIQMKRNIPSPAFLNWCSLPAGT